MAFVDQIHPGPSTTHMRQLMPSVHHQGQPTIRYNEYRQGIPPGMITGNPPAVAGGMGVQICTIASNHCTCSYPDNLFCIACGNPMAVRNRIEPCCHVVCSACTPTQTLVCPYCNRSAINLRLLHPADNLYICSAGDCRASFLNSESYKLHTAMSPNCALHLSRDDSANKILTGRHYTDIHPLQSLNIPLKSPLPVDTVRVSGITGTAKDLFASTPQDVSVRTLHTEEIRPAAVHTSSFVSAENVQDTSSDWGIHRSTYEEATVTTYDSSRSEDRSELSHDGVLSHCGSSKPVVSSEQAYLTDELETSLWDNTCTTTAAIDAATNAASLSAVLGSSCIADEDELNIFL